MNVFFAAIGIFAILFLLAAAYLWVWFARPPLDSKKSQPKAKVIADSLSNGYRITTMVVRFHRFVLAEFNTHTTFARNSASSRAIPVKKQIRMVWDYPAIPSHFPSEKSGMQGGDELSWKEQARSQRMWLRSARFAAVFAYILSKLRVHKSVTNRILEPYLFHEVVVTATAWQNFFDQRISPLAQREIHDVALLMREAYNSSVPKELDPDDGIHAPFVEELDIEVLREIVAKESSSLDPDVSLRLRIARVSSARSARVSYLTHEGVRDIDKDFKLFLRLTEADPKHWSPMNHVAFPAEDNSIDVSMDISGIVGDGRDEIQFKQLPAVGQFAGWLSFRHVLEGHLDQQAYR